MSSPQGTNFGLGNNPDYMLTDSSGLAILATCTGAPPTTASVFQVGCIMIQTNGSGNSVYQNTGTSASPTWTLFDTGTAFQLPTSSTDATTTTGTSFSLTQNAITSGTGQLQTVNGLTTGVADSIVHTTSVIASGGSLQRISSTSIDTGTTNGVLLDLSSTASLAATQVLLTASALTTGIGMSIVTNALTTGTAMSIPHTTSVIADGGSLLRLSSTSVDTGGATHGTLLDLSNTGATAATLVELNDTALLTGVGVLVAHTTGVLASGGSLLRLSSTSVDTGTTHGVLLDLTSSAGTTGTQAMISATGLTTGIGLALVAAQATMTTGRYLSVNNGATEVFGIGLNGHLISTVSANPPTAASTVNQGISAAAITAGGTDTCGTITTTGTQNNTADSTFTVTFGKTYTTAPKAVILTPANAAAALAAQSGAYISSISATAFVVGVSKSSAAAATPSWNYFVIA